MLWHKKPAKPEPPGWWKRSVYEILVPHLRKVPVDLDAIARGLGIEVIRAPLGAASGKLARVDEEPYPQFIIHVNCDHHPLRQRYTLAHEIAHFALHRDLIGSGIVDDDHYRSALDQEYEAQANSMAADIVIPNRTLEQEWKFGCRDSKELAERFGVTQKAMAIRVDALIKAGRIASPAPKEEPMFRTDLDEIKDLLVTQKVAPSVIAQVLDLARSYANDYASDAMQEYGERQ